MLYHCHWAAFAERRIWLGRFDGRGDWQGLRGTCERVIPMFLVGTATAGPGARYVLQPLASKAKK